jgi:hypothetical protein
MKRRKKPAKRETETFSNAKLAGMLQALADVMEQVLDSQNKFVRLLIEALEGGPDYHAKVQARVEALIKKGMLDDLLTKCGYVKKP